MYFMLFSIPIECQTEMEWFTVEAKINELEKQIKERPEFSVEAILERGSHQQQESHGAMPDGAPRQSSHHHTKRHQG